MNGGPPSAAPQAIMPVNGALREVPPSSDSAPAEFYLTDRLPHAMVLDALPYVDPLPTEQQQQVQQLLQQEMAAIARESGGPDKLPDYLSDLPLPQTPVLDDVETMLGKEMARKAKGDPIPELDMSKYTSFSVPSGSKATDVKAWEKTVTTCQQLLQHAATAHINLELMNAHAAASWQRHLTNLTQTKDRLTAATKRRTEEENSICKTRKVQQVEASGTLKQLEQTAQQYKNNNASIIEALGPLTAEVMDLKAKCRIRGILPEYAEEDEFDSEAWLEAVNTTG
ncbi:Pre-mRNA-splicing factor SPF27-like protein, related [Eimeria praecox]|uniref:Pre-mRNA-splicing factor SPF27-like protein, related n=1 Tax=Eimeria praecox TaxID=51316 RepID=U6H257_9EIME|nr:Pre-mRNA-splicing factor SPF27-like protein, related [Eimeria praecox]